MAGDRKKGHRGGITVQRIFDFSPGGSENFEDPGVRLQGFSLPLIETLNSTLPLRASLPTVSNYF